MFCVLPLPSDLRMDSAKRLTLFPNEGETAFKLVGQRFKNNFAIKSILYSISRCTKYIVLLNYIVEFFERTAPNEDNNFT